MCVLSALRHLSSRRRDHEIVVSNQSSARLWPQLSQHPLDFNFNPSTMGGAVPLGVGLALAQPHREVIVLSGDGSLLMSLGCLVTAIASGVNNLSILLLDNEMFEVTGGQKTAASEIAIDYPALATAAGFPTVSNFEDLQHWQTSSQELFTSGGPRFARLAVGPTSTDLSTDLAPAIDQRIRLFQRALCNS